MIDNRDYFNASASAVSVRFAMDEGPAVTWSMLRRADISASAPPLIQGAPAQSALDMLRTKVAAAMRANGWTTLAVTAPSAGCGTTTIAAGLASSLARQHDTRVVLFDFNLRRPGIDRALGVQGKFAIADFLRGGSDVRDHIVRKTDRLAIAPNGSIVSDPAEILQSAQAASAIDRVRKSLAPNFVIFDLPPMLEHDDLLGFLPSVDCVLLVLGAEGSSVGQTDACERELAARGKLLGVVLNKCRLGLGEFDA